MINRSITGKFGEDLSCDYLIRKGYRIINRNYRRKIGEIDIIAISKDKTLVFFEVKTMKESGNAAINLHDGKIAELIPEDNLTNSKLKKVSRTCELFIAENPELIHEQKGWRIDLIAISLSSDLKPSIRHYENLSL